VIDINERARKKKLMPKAGEKYPLLVGAWESLKVVSNSWNWNK
jgi:hypothetical protein